MKKLTVILILMISAAVAHGQSEQVALVAKPKELADSTHLLIDSSEHIACEDERKYQNKDQEKRPIKKETNTAFRNRTHQSSLPRRKNSL